MGPMNRRGTAPHPIVRRRFVAARRAGIAAALSVLPLLGATTSAQDHPVRLPRVTPRGTGEVRPAEFAAPAEIPARPPFDLSPNRTPLFDHPPLRYDDTDFQNPGYLGDTTERNPWDTGVASLDSTLRTAMQEPDNGRNIGEPLMVEDESVAPQLSDYKDGFFQKLSFTGTWINRGDSADYGLSELELFTTVAVPMPTRDWPMLITPLFEVQYLDGPDTPDMPARLYETYVDFMWVPRLNERWTMILAVAPSVYSDFEADTSDAFRWTGKGLVRYDWSPTLQLLAGVLYLNRDDVRLLAAGGLIWNPSPDVRYEVVFPRPKLAHRILIGDCYEEWLYLAGEFGGNTWAIQRADGSPDRLTLRDLRFMIGLERKRGGGAGRRIEVGYVFAREAEYASGTPSVEPGSTVMLRAGVSY